MERGSDTAFPARLAAARGGDERALEDLLARYLPGLHAYVRLRADRIVRARESISDVVQSVCGEIVARLASFGRDDEPAFRKWVFLTAEQKVVDRFRFWRAARRDPDAEVQPGPTAADEAVLLESYATFCTPSEDAIAREEVARIEGAFTRLPEACRESILLVRVAGLSHTEAAERAGRSVESLRHALYRGLALLTEELGP